MPSFGPQYCETPYPYDGSFPAEPWNAYSSLVICVWGLIAWGLVIRRRPDFWPFHLMCLLLVANGAGSTLWHGLRTHWSLTFDFLPAMIFVLIGAFLWAWRVAPLWQAVLLIVFLVGGDIVLRTLMPGGFIFAIAGVVVAGAIWLIVRTSFLSRTATITGVIAVSFAVVALACRSFDLQMCGPLPMGSHFLWHILLSTAAFTLMVTLLTLYRAPETATKVPSPR